MNNTISTNDNLISLISCQATGLRISGAYAEVHQCELNDGGKKPKLVALKSYKSMSNEKIRSEIGLLSGFHQNVVPFLGLKEDGATISLVMPWMSDGTLTSFINTHGRVLETADRSMLLHDVSSGLHYLHSNFVVHGNFESGNILINEQHKACLSGFRQSVRLSSREAECPPSRMPPKPAIQFAGPEWFAAGDERFQPLSRSLFDSDVYSLGCVILHIFTNCMPWYDATSMDISDKLRQCVTPSRPLDSMIDDNQWNIVEPCLLSLPRNRPSMSRLLKSVEGYLVSVGPRNLSGQIKIPQMFANARGGYGDVYEGIWERKTGGKVKVAVKMLYIHDHTAEELAKVEKKLKTELAAWRRLSHANIVSLLGTTTIPNKGNIKAMVSLWMENGSLDKYIKAKKDVLTPSQRLCLVKDIAEGLKYLHQYPIVHGDLTPFNVLINNDGRALLTDFGLSVILGGFVNLSCTYTDGKMGPSLWSAPELLSDETPKLSTKSDMYSFACIMYLIFSGRHPWVARNHHELVSATTRVRNGDRPSKSADIEARYCSLIEQCWDMVPNSRPTISTVSQKLQ